MIDDDIVMNLFYFARKAGKQGAPVCAGAGSRERCFLRYIPMSPTLCMYLRTH